MKFVGFWSYEPNDAQKAIDTWMASLEKRKKNPGNYPKTIFGPYQYNGQTSGFTCLEADNPDQLTYLATDYMGVLTWDFVPIIANEEAAKIFSKNK